MNRTFHNLQESWSDFDRNFKIPKKNFNKSNWSDQNPACECKIVENVYDQCESSITKYPASESSSAFHQPNNFQSSQQLQSNFGLPLSDYDNLPHFDCDVSQDYPAHYQPNQAALSNQEPFHLNQTPSYSYHFNSLKRPREVPKNNIAGVKYADTFPHLSDPTLPRELTEQFQPLYCKLCVSKLSSNSMAKLHYKSKNHEKKVRKFLLEYAARTGEPLHERAQSNASKKQKQEDNDPKYFHCDVCDLPLTGRLHAESHYMGKNHQKAMAGKTPAGRGHYNDEGKWVRRTVPVAVPSDRDNFGLDFALPTEFASTEEVKPKKLHCEICDVKVTSDQQMALHLSGQKHTKRLKQQTGDTVDEIVEGDPENNILSTLSSPNVPSGDLSVYRTPTGYYYCNPCNLSLNSEIQFKQHLGSKKHRKKASGSKE